MKQSGWLDEPRRVLSDNYDQRPSDTEISLLVIHNISLPPGSFGDSHIEDFFCNKLDINAHPYFSEIADLAVSAHLLIDRQGQLVQFVSFLQRAWHAGDSSYEGCDNCNNYSIGIELEGVDAGPYTDAQYKALAQVTSLLITAYPGLTKDRIVGHSDIAPGRKTDPGAFDWQRYLSAL